MRARTLVVRFTGDSTQLIGELGKIEGKTTSLGKLEQAGKVAFGALAAGGAVAAAGIAYSVKSFMDFDAALNQSIAIMGDVSDAMRGDMSDAARQVALTTTFSAEEAAGAFYGLASAGLSAEQSIKALPLVAKFAQAGMLDLANASDYLTTTQAALGLVTADATQNLVNMTRIADVLTEVNNLAQGRVEDFAQALTNKAATAMATMNIELEEGVAVLGAFAKKGVVGQVAGEKLAIFLRDTARAAVRNKDAFADLGIEIFDQTGNLKNLADVVAEFEDALGPMSDAEKASALESAGMTRAVGDIIRTLMGSSGTIREFETALRGAGGTTEEVATKQLDTFSAKWELLKHAFQDMAIEIGENIVPALIPVVEWITEHLPGAFEKMKTIWREDLQPALEDVRDLLESDVLPLLEKLGNWLREHEGVAKGFSAGIVFATVALAALYAVMKAVAAVKGVWALLGAVGSVLWPAIKAIGMALAVVISFIGVIFTYVNMLILGPIGAFVRLLLAIIWLVNRFSWLFVDAWHVIYTVVSAVLGFLADHWQFFFTMVTLGAFLIATIVVQQWEHIREFIGGILGWLWDRMVNFWHLVQGVWNVITIVAVYAFHAVAAAANWAWDWITARTEGLRIAIWDALSWLGGLASDVWFGIARAANAAWDWIYGIVAGVINWIADRIAWLWGKIEGVGNFLSDLPGAGVISEGLDFVFGATGGIVPMYLAPGGMVPRGTDVIPAMLTPGEMVLTARQQRNLFGLLQAGGARGLGSGGDEVTGGDTYLVFNNPIISSEAQFEGMVVGALRSAGRKGTPITIRGRRL